MEKIFKSNHTEISDINDGLLSDIYNFPLKGAFFMYEYIENR